MKLIFVISSLLIPLTAAQWSHAGSYGYGPGSYGYGGLLGYGTGVRGYGYPGLGLGNGLAL